MNLQPVAIENIPVGMPLPWRLFDREGRILFTQGDTVANPQQLETLRNEGLMRDMDELPAAQAAESPPSHKTVVTSEFFPPAGIKPQVEERVQLCMQGGATPIHYPARLIGYIRGVSILVTTPVVNGIPITLRDGEHVEVRMLIGSNICIFHSALQRVCISPTHYMHLEYPSIVHIQELRKSPRARVSFSATATNAQGAQEVAHIVNLSSHGAQIRVPAQLGQKGDSLKLVFHAAMDNMKTTLELDAQIQHVHSTRQLRDEETGILEYGIAFRDTPVEQTLWLSALVYQHIAEGDIA